MHGEHLRSLGLAPCTYSTAAVWSLTRAVGKFCILKIVMLFVAGAPTTLRWILMSAAPSQHRQWWGWFREPSRALSLTWPSPWRATPRYTSSHLIIGPHPIMTAIFTTYLPDFTHLTAPYLFVKLPRLHSFTCLCHELCVVVCNTLFCGDNMGVHYGLALCRCAPVHCFVFVPFCHGNLCYLCCICCSCTIVPPSGEDTSWSSGSYR